MEIKKRWHEQCLEDLKNNTSLFEYIPNNIGEIIYCDSTNKKVGPDSTSKKLKKILVSIIIPLIIVALCWIIIKHQLMVNIIVSFFALFAILISLIFVLTFSGTDYFVGTKGAVSVSFVKSRKNYTIGDTILFRDFDQLYTSETIHIKNGYDHTEYNFFVKGKYGNIICSVNSNYFQAKPQKPDNYYKDSQYRYWKTIEQRWTMLKFNEVKDIFNRGGSVGFEYFTNNKYHNNYIQFRGNNIYIGNKTYHKDNLKDYKLKEGYLTIYNQNHRKGGIFREETGDKSVIIVSNIGNNKLFLAFFNHFLSNIK